MLFEHIITIAIIIDTAGTTTITDTTGVTIIIIIGTGAIITGVTTEFPYRACGLVRQFDFVTRCNAQQTAGSLLGYTGLNRNAGRVGPMAKNLRFPTVLAIAAILVTPIAFCACAGTAQAQGSPPPTIPAVTPPPRLTLTAEQEYIIREIVFKDMSVQKENSAPETVGDAVPENIKLYPLPPEVIQKVPQARSHMFFVRDDEIVLVSSSDRRIADVIKKKSTD